MLTSAYSELRAIKEARGDRAFISIKEALKAIETVHNKLAYKIDVRIDDMLRQTDIEECKKILKGLKNDNRKNNND